MLPTVKGLGPLKNHVKKYCINCCCKNQFVIKKNTFFLLQNYMWIHKYQEGIMSIKNMHKIKLGGFSSFFFHLSQIWLIPSIFGSEYFPGTRILKKKTDSVFRFGSRSSFSLEHQIPIQNPSQICSHRTLFSIWLKII